MKPRFLLDTNVLSEALRPLPNAMVMGKLETHESEVATAAPVWHELWFGCRRLPSSRRRRLIEMYLTDVVGASMPVLPYDTEAAAWHATERAHLSRAGKPPPFVDGQIAAIAAVNSLVLVTENASDFRWFRDLTVVDWSRS